MWRAAALLAAAGALCSAVASQALAAPVVFDGATQDSASATDAITLTKLTVSAGANRFLIVGVEVAGNTTAVARITWSQTPLTRLGATVSGGGSPCRAELWALVEPRTGNNALDVVLTSSAAFGVGAAAYSGVDPDSPTGPFVTAGGSGTPVSLDLAAPSGRPLVASACLGGRWTTGSPQAAADAVPGAGQQTLWDFTEPGIVGIGSHRLAGGQSPLRWDISSSFSYAWTAAGVWLTPVGLAPPADAAAPPDAPSADRQPEDATLPAADAPAVSDTQGSVGERGPGAGADVAPAPDGGAGAADAGTAPGADASADRVPGGGALDASGVEDAGAASLEGGAAREINLGVGCACRAGQGAATSGVTSVLVSVVALGWRAFRRRRLGGAPPGPARATLRRP
jgi:hypothetical protein